MAGSVDDLDLAKAFKELAHGENTALALENHLAKLERKIDELLAAVEDNTHDEQPEARDKQQPAHHEEDDSSKSASK
ncbi:hypothetical protein TMatcc_000813 [Talaromyces marneffei ATCC 18224]